MKNNARFAQLDGSSLTIGIVKARWNEKMVNALFEDCTRALRDCGIAPDRILVTEVPGSYELPYAAQHLIDTKRPDAVVCIGTLIKGETMHFEYIAESVSRGIMQVSLEAHTPIIFGVLACLTEEQARDRSAGEKSHGYDWGLSAVEMGLLKQK